MNKNKNELQLQIGENVRQCRDSKGLTQEELVKMLESMPNDDLEFIENNILLVCNWLNQKSK